MAIIKEYYTWEDCLCLCSDNVDEFIHPNDRSWFSFGDKKAETRLRLADPI